MASKPESLLRTKIANALRSVGAFVRVVHSDAHGAGALDLDVVYRGRAVKLEIKTPQNTEGMSKIQLNEQAAVRAAGGAAEECRSVADALSILELIEKGKL